MERGGFWWEGPGNGFALSCAVCRTATGIKHPPARRAFANTCVKFWPGHMQAGCALVHACAQPDRSSHRASRSPMTRDALVQPVQAEAGEAGIEQLQAILAAADDAVAARAVSDKHLAALAVVVADISGMQAGGSTARVKDLIRTLKEVHQSTLPKAAAELARPPRVSPAALQQQPSAAQVSAAWEGRSNVNGALSATLRVLEPLVYLPYAEDVTSIALLEVASLKLASQPCFARKLQQSLTLHARARSSISVWAHRHACPCGPARTHSGGQRQPRAHVLVCARVRVHACRAQRVLPATVARSRVPKLNNWRAQGPGRSVQRAICFRKSDSASVANPCACLFSGRGRCRGGRRCLYHRGVGAWPRAGPGHGTLLGH